MVAELKVELDNKVKLFEKFDFLIKISALNCLDIYRNNAMLGHGPALEYSIIRIENSIHTYGSWDWNARSFTVSFTGASIAAYTANKHAAARSWVANVNFISGVQSSNYFFSATCVVIRLTTISTQHVAFKFLLKENPLASIDMLDLMSVAVYT
jgi:hypothetical protein